MSKKVNKILKEIDGLSDVDGEQAFKDFVLSEMEPDAETLLECMRTLAEGSSISIDAAVRLLDAIPQMIELVATKDSSETTGHYLSDELQVRQLTCGEIVEIARVCQAVMNEVVSPFELPQLCELLLGSEGGGFNFEIAGQESPFVMKFDDGFEMPLIVGQVNLLLVHYRGNIKAMRILESY